MLFQLGATDFSKEADKKLGEGETTERNNSLADKFTQMANLLIHYHVYLIETNVFIAV